jgi:hypothetical protein
MPCGRGLQASKIKNQTMGDLECRCFSSTSTPLPARKQRDVLYLSFPAAEQRESRTPYEQLDSRKRIIEWFDGSSG